MAFKVVKSCTVTKVWQKIDTVKAWKEKPTMEHPMGESKSITENRGYHISIKELGLAVPVGMDEPDVQPGDVLTFTLEKP